jgi:hypothetical protein
LPARERPAGRRGFLLQWRDRNKTEDFRANGCHGMLSGSVADPND